MPEFSPIAEELLKTRYFQNGEDWEELCRRVAKTIAGVEKTKELRKKWEEIFFNILYNLEFLPNSPVLWGAGFQKKTLSACFVIPVEDNLESIFEAVKRAGMIFKAGGGVGINFSKLRPRGQSVSAGGTASGAIIFLELFDTTGDVIKQGGQRRSAQMSILHCGHPEIRDFILAKSEPGKLTNMNLSVAITNDFMKKATSDNSRWDLVYHNETIKDDAKKLLDLMAQEAWKSGEPGLVFLDRMNDDNSCPKVAKIKGTNPCVTGDTWVNTSEGRKQIQNIIGEKVVLIINGEETPTTDEGFFFTGVKPVYRIKTVDGHTLKATADHKIMTNSGWKEVRHLDKEDEIFLDNNMTSRFASRRFICPQEPVYDCTVPDGHKFVANGMIISNCSEQPLRPNESCTLGSINLDKFTDENGIFDVSGFEECVYNATRFLDNTIEANYFPDDLIDNATKKTRPIGLGIMGLADHLIKRRIVYGSDESLGEIDFICKVLHRETVKSSALIGEEKGSFPAFRKSKFVKKYKAMRNSQHNTIAPTGTISIIAGCSSGIEPYYSFASIQRSVAGFNHDVIIDSKYKYILQSGIEEWKKVLISGQEIPADRHIQVLAAAQKHIDTGISKTISLPEEATVEDVKNVYILAWQLGCKGVTVFRERNQNRQALLKEVCPEHKVPLVPSGRCMVCPVCGFSNRCSIG